MKHRFAMPILRTIIGAVALAAAAGGLILLPACWLRWEADHAREQAKMMTDTEVFRIQHDMRDLIDKFERATGWIRVQDLTGDSVALTGRLLRAEPLVAPRIWPDDTQPTRRPSCVFVGVPASRKRSADMVPEPASSPIGTDCVAWLRHRRPRAVELAPG